MTDLARAAGFSEDLFSGHTRSERIGQALELLAARQVAYMERRESDTGRPPEVWFAVGPGGSAQA